MSAPDPDLLDILGKFTEYVQNERVRSYNEGVDAERARLVRIIEAQDGMQGYKRRIITMLQSSD